MQRQVKRVVLLFLAALTGCQTGKRAVVDRAPNAVLISFDELRSRSVRREVSWINPDGSDETLSLTELDIPSNVDLADDYLKHVYGDLFSADLRDVWPLMIVLHSMAVGSLRVGLEQSGFLDDEVDYGISKWGKMPVGAHFLVDRDGRIYCLAPPRNGQGDIDYGAAGRFPLKRHVIEANPWAIGIENVAPEALNWTDLAASDKAKVFSDLTTAQIAADGLLARWLGSRAAGPGPGNAGGHETSRNLRFIFSHDQFTRADFRARLPRILPVSSNPNYLTTNRYDTGADFLRAVLAQATSRGRAFTSSPSP